MNIKDFPDIEYYHLFEIESVKNAKNNIVELLNEIEQFDRISLANKKRIRKYVNDFCSLSNRIIKRQDIVTVDDYEFALSSLIIIISQIHKIILESCNKELSHKQIMKISGSCRKIKLNLPFGSTPLQEFVNNHLLLSLYFSIVLVILGLSIIALHSLTVKIVLLILVITLFVVFIYFLLSRKIDRISFIDEVNKTIYKNTYTYKRKKRMVMKDVDMILKLLETLK